MRLAEIKIKNYRSIEEQVFILEEKNKSFTYTLIGINEAGKSSFLNAISLIDGGDVVYPRDFFDEKFPIEVSLKYLIEEKDSKTFKEELEKKITDKTVISQIGITHVEVGVVFMNTPDLKKQNFEKYTLVKDSISGYFLNGPAVEKKIEGQEVEDLSVQKLLELNFPQYFYKNSHFITFWKSDPKHLIGESINLDIFAPDPEKVSIPLYNCFLLAEVEDIQAEILSIKTDVSRRQNLVDKLGDSVTAHIKKIWPNHPIKIKFNINNMMIEFLIEDDDVKYKTKTTGQRSDGFKQFISFLLTISAEHSNNSLNRSLLLLDEPETHLHPKAQEFLKDELIKITKNNKNNNIVIFATHSNYMIDRECIGRCYKVEKKENKKTVVSKIEGNTSSYAETNYDVFEIPTTDYHNELYGILQEKSGKYVIADFDDYLDSKGISKDKTYNKVTKEKKIEPSKTTLPTYVRNMIHHPENPHNQKYSQAELEKSIKNLIKVKTEYSKKTK